MINPHGPRVPQKWATVDEMMCASAARAAERGSAEPAQAIASNSGGQSWADCAEQAGNIAALLREVGVQLGDKVAVLSTRDDRLPSLVAGILHAGAVYCPLDASAPAARLEFQLKDLQPTLLVTVGGAGAGVGKEGIKTQWDLDDADLQARIAAADGDALKQKNDALTGEDACYITYTSGSTGTPKAVINHHAGVAQHLEWFGELLGRDGDLRVLQKAPMVFDVGIAEVLNPLANGGAVVMPDADWWMGDIDGFVDLVEEQQVTALSMVPSMMRTLLDVMDDMGEPLSRLGSLRHLLLGGEAVPADIARRAREEIGCRVHGLYGPTEAAMDVAWVEFTADSDVADGVNALGRPEDSVSLYVVAEDGSEVQEYGVPGELCIAGVQVASGYLNRPELTAEVFVPSLHPDVDGGRMYKTGDIAQWVAGAEGGSLEFLGRIGDQVKIRGNRVELGEVEAALRSADGVRDAAVAAVGEGDKSLVGFVVRADASSSDTDANGFAERLKASLGEVLPGYMVPNRIVELSALPMNANGKLDRRALADKSAI